jgi:SAM-dependent methyltransferase
MTALYDHIGTTYARYRRPDPRVAAAIDAALADARTVANIGAGSGSYEPTTRIVTAVEPARTMIAQRQPTAAPAIEAVAEHLPFRDHHFDAALALLTTHHWPDPHAGLAEMARISRRQVIFTHGRASFLEFWLTTDYVPELPQLVPADRFLPPVEDALHITDIIPVPVPWDCTDGFLCAYWRRPEMYLDPDARAAISGLALIGEQALAPAMRRLRDDIDSGAWDNKYGHLRALDELDLGYRIIISEGLRP